MGAFVSVQQPRIDVTILKIFSPKIFFEAIGNFEPNYAV
jgi:hypothetical protein